MKREKMDKTWKITEEVEIGATVNGNYINFFACFLQENKDEFYSIEFSVLKENNLTHLYTEMCKELQSSNSSKTNELLKNKIKAQ